jgi:hypothetical protein
MDIKAILTLSSDNCICNHFSIEGKNILFDCGWDEEFSERISDIYKEYYFK